MGQGETNKEIGARLTLTRRKLGYDKQPEFVEVLNTVLAITSQRWSSYESGRERITLNIALVLCDRFDLSLD